MRIGKRRPCQFISSFSQSRKAPAFEAWEQSSHTHSPTHAFCYAADIQSAWILWPTATSTRLCKLPLHVVSPRQRSTLALPVIPHFTELYKSLLPPYIIRNRNRADLFSQSTITCRILCYRIVLPLLSLLVEVAAEVEAKERICMEDSRAWKKSLQTWNTPAASRPHMWYGRVTYSLFPRLLKIN